jgi:hypothetical protein
MSDSYWVDEQKVQMAPANTWPTLNLNQLIETKSQILDKMQAARGQPAFMKPLMEALQQLDALISAKLADPSARD